MWERKNLWWNKSTKSMVQLDEFAITILLELAPRKKVGKCFLFKVTWNFWEHQKKVICCSMEYDTVTFFLHIWHWSVCVVLDVFGLSQVLLFERYWKLTSGRSQPYLKSSNRNWQHFSDGYQDPNHVLSWHGGPLKTEKKTNALMILFSTTTWDRIIFHRIQWILLEDMNETCSVKTPSLFYWNRGGNSYPNRYDFCESTVCHAFPPWNQ